MSWEFNFKPIVVNYGTASVKGQIINNSDIAGHTVSVTTT